MSDVIGKVVTCLFVIAGMFLLPLINIATVNDNTVQTVVYQQANSFVDSVCTHGYVSQADYNELMSVLDATDLRYSVELTVGHETVVPVYETQISESGTSSTVIVGTKTVDELAYTDKILTELFSTEGIYKLSKGDSISIRIVNAEDTTSQRLRQVILRIFDTGERISVVAGGIVRDETF